jgi:hypothetical protein
LVSAEAEMRAAVDITTSLVGEDNWRTARAQSALGWTLIKEGKFAEGEPMLTDARARLLAAVGPHDDATVQASRRLAEYYRDHQRDAEAAKVLATTNDP